MAGIINLFGLFGANMAEDGNNQLVGGNNDDGGDDIFVYTGGQAPHDVKRAKIDESLDTIPRDAFNGCRQLIEVEGHDKLSCVLLLDR
jgi:hypothetical protein